MLLTDEQKDAIKKEYESFVDSQYAGKSKEERQELGQFFTPPELIFKMLEKFENLEGKILDPTCGSGQLLIGCIIAGADPKKCYGIELDKVILEKVCIPRLEKLGVPKENLRHGNALNRDCYNFELEEGETYSFDSDDGDYGKVNIIRKDGTKKFRFGGI